MVWNVWLQASFHESDRQGTNSFYLPVFTTIRSQIPIPRSIPHDLHRILTSCSTTHTCYTRIHSCMQLHSAFCSLIVCLHRTRTERRRNKAQPSIELLREGVASQVIFPKGSEFICRNRRRSVGIWCRYHSLVTPIAVIASAVVIVVLVVDDVIVLRLEDVVVDQRVKERGEDVISVRPVGEIFLGILCSGGSGAGDCARVRVTVWLWWNRLVDGVSNRSGQWFVGAGIYALPDELLAEVGVPVVLDLVICAPRNPPGYQRPPAGRTRRSNRRHDEETLGVGGV
ncbi:hypothetical protein MUK42_36631 [Musa troglodytarum]|uniref:Uncharacterized protein n=1 Tax=Musa troglodytarum TaxID=320322 RepID=A0A9E7GAD0_9LILI|nr:hypothetical protein MUK42_36631 [Musa troglodytarum]